MSQDRPDFDAPRVSSVDSIYAFMAQARETEFEEEKPAAGRRRFPFALLGVLVIVAALVFADRQTALLGGHVWAPAAEPTVVPSGLAFCEGVSTKDRNRIERAAIKMGQAGEASELLAMLIDEQICIGTEDLDYLAGYTEAGGSIWRPEVRHIMLDTGTLRHTLPDEAAAILVHEATHAARVFDGSSCFLTSDCQILTNGNEVEEEVAAHAAEARFWIEIHGHSGTRTGSSWTGTAVSRFENSLVFAYGLGPEHFEEFVIRIRSSPIELLEWTEDD
jgi:hypothetical protein